MGTVTSTSGPTPSAAPDPYVLGSGERERARLLEHCDVRRASAGALVDQVGIGPGARAVDVGCGPLGVLDVLAERVGSGGLVVGLERDARMLDMATRSLHERDLQGVRLVRGEAEATGLSGGYFDLAHERSVVLHTPRPERVVAEMARVVRPGGFVAVQEIDAVSVACQPPHPAWDRLRDALFATWDELGIDVHIGRRLPDLLRTAGLVDVGIDAHIGVWRSGDMNHRQLLHFVGLVRDRIVASGALTEAELDASAADLSAHLDHPDTFTLDAVLTQAWARKP